MDKKDKSFDSKNDHLESQNGQPGFVYTQYDTGAKNRIQSDDETELEQNSESQNDQPS